jgi:hypothetical protein
MSPDLILSLCAILTCLGCTATVLYRGGALVGRIETVLDRVTGIEQKVSTIPELNVRIGVVQEVATQMRSDHKALAVRVAEIESAGAYIRGKLDSQHDA